MAAPGLQARPFTRPSGSGQSSPDQPDSGPSGAEILATAIAARAQNLASARRSLACKKTVATLAHQIARLESPLHVILEFLNPAEGHVHRHQHMEQSLMQLPVKAWAVKSLCRSSQDRPALAQALQRYEGRYLLHHPR